MIRESPRSIVCELPARLAVEREPDLRADAREGIKHPDSGKGIVALLFATAANELKTRLVDHRRRENRGLSQLKTMLGGSRVVRAGQQIKISDSSVFAHGA